MNLYQWLIVGIMGLHFIVSTVIAVLKYKKFEKGFEIPCQELTVSPESLSAEEGAQPSNVDESDAE